MGLMVGGWKVRGEMGGEDRGSSGGLSGSLSGGGRRGNFSLAWFCLVVQMYVPLWLPYDCDSSFESSSSSTFLGQCTILEHFLPS